MYNVEDALKERTQNQDQEIKDLEADIKKSVEILRRKVEKFQEDPTLDEEEEIKNLKNLIHNKN